MKNLYEDESLKNRDDEGPFVITVKCTVFSNWRPGR